MSLLLSPMGPCCVLMRRKRRAGQINDLPEELLAITTSWKLRV